MIPLEECVAVLLCAGLSRRFGFGNKLLAPVRGRPLAAHAAELCSGVPFARRFAVVPQSEPALNALLLDFRFSLLVNSKPEAGKDSSLRLGLAAALAHEPRGAVILLGDMPHVTLAHLKTLSAAAADEVAAISVAHDVISPPTLIPSAAMRLALYHSDQPVRDSLGRLAYVTAPSAMLIDYDSREQFLTTADGDWTTEFR